MEEQKKKSVFKTYMIYFIAMVLFCGVRIVFSLGLCDGLSTKASDIIFTTIIQVGILFLVPFVLYMILIGVKPKAVFKTCNYSKTTFSVVLVSFGLGLIAFVLNIIVSSIFNGIISFTGYQTPLSFTSAGTPDYSVANFFLQVLLVAVMPALAEEFLHRGLLLQGTKHIGFNKAIIISSICFGLIHFNINQVGYAIVLGLVMGFASVVAKNIWVAVIIHFTNNFIATYLEFAEANNWLFGNYQNIFTKLEGLNFILLCVVCFVVLCVVALLLYFFMVLLFKQAIIKRINKAIAKVYNSESGATDEPVVIDQGQVLQEMLENNTMINLNYEEMKSPLDIIMPKQTKVYKPSFKDNIFLICSLFLGITITIFTYVWGFF